MNLVKFNHPGNQHFPLGKGYVTSLEERFYEEKQVGNPWVVDKWSSQEHTTENKKAKKQLLQANAKYIITNLHDV